MESWYCDWKAREIDDRFCISKLCVIVNLRYIAFGNQDLCPGLKLAKKTGDSQPIEKYFSKCSHDHRFIFTRALIQLLLRSSIEIISRAFI